MRAASSASFIAALRDFAVGEVLQAVAHAAHVKARELLRLVARADDELGRAAADVDDEPLLLRRRQAVLHAEVDETRFFAACDDLDRKAERGLRVLQERACVLRDAQRIGADRAHRVPVEAAQAFAEALQAGERALLRGCVEQLVFVEPGAEPHGLAQGIEGIDLIADDAGDLAVEGVASEIDAASVEYSAMNYDGAS